MNKTIAPISFNILIAYLLPGFIALYGLSYISPAVKRIFEAILTKDTQIGASFLLLLGASTVGVIISGIRGNILDWLQEKTGIIKPVFDYGTTIDPHVREAFENVINNQYRYAQCYGNFSISLLLLFILKLSFSNVNLKEQWPFLLLTAITVVLIFISYRIYLQSAYNSLGQITKAKIVTLKIEES